MLEVNHIFGFPQATCMRSKKHLFGMSLEFLVGCCIYVCAASSWTKYNSRGPTLSPDSNIAKQHQAE